MSVTVWIFVVVFWVLVASIITVAAGSSARRVRASMWRNSQPITEALVNAKDEAVLLGPVSAWVAEGEARAVYEWTAQRSTGKAPIILGPGVEYIPLPTQSDCDDCDWVDTTPLNAYRRQYMRGLACAKHSRDPDLPDPMREAEWR